MDRNDLIIFGGLLLFISSIFGGTFLSVRHTQDIEQACILTLKDKPAMDIHMLCQKGK